MSFDANLEGKKDSHILERSWLSVQKYVDGWKVRRVAGMPSQGRSRCLTSIIFWAVFLVTFRADTSTQIGWRLKLGILIEPIQYNKTIDRLLHM